MMRRRSLSFPLYLSLLFTLLLTSCEKEPPTIVRVNLEEFTDIEMQQIGDFFQNASRQPSSPYAVLSPTEHADLYDYMNTMVEMLAYTEQIEHSRSFNWSVSIIDADSIASAFVLPGGHIHIYTGMIKILEDESELAALLAHEMMYTDQGLVINEIKENFSGALLGDILLGNEISQSEIESILNWVAGTSFSEQQVRDADAFSVRTVCPFLYDATGMLRLLERINQGGQSNNEIEWLNIRPGNVSERIDALLIASETSCENLNGNRYAERFEKMKALLP